MSILSYFTDALLRGPTVGSMLMCATASLIGAIVYVRKQSLVGEALSHATYPGLILGVLLYSWLANENDDLLLSILIMIGAFFTALLGLYCVNILQRKLRISGDAALCFVLSSFFGIGITLASHVQFTHSMLYRKAQAYLYGQAATMSDIHIILYGSLLSIVLVAILVLYKEILTITFNRDYAKSVGMPVRKIDTLLFLLTTLAIVVGIRSVGVVLVSSMLIAPPIAARQLTHRFSTFLILSLLIGLLSGFLGNYLSTELSQRFSAQELKTRFIFPTGPSIVLSAAFLCVFSLLYKVIRKRTHQS